MQGLRARLWLRVWLVPQFSRDLFTCLLAMAFDSLSSCSGFGFRRFLRCHLGRIGLQKVRTRYCPKASPDARPQRLETMPYM